MAAEKGKTVTTPPDPLNVFRFENEWNSNLFACCEDVKLSKIKVNTLSY